MLRDLGVLDDDSVHASFFVNSAGSKRALNCFGPSPGFTDTSLPIVGGPSSLAGILAVQRLAHGKT